jgi:hypothetical protein
MPTASGTKSFNHKEIERLNHDIAEGIIKNIHQQLEDDDTNFTGEMSASFVVGKESGFTTVESNSKYSGFIEFGMPSGQVIDKDKLQVWVEGKLGITDKNELIGVTDKIYKKLIRDGIAPRRYFKKAIRKFIGEHGSLAIRAKRATQASSSGGFAKSKPGKNLRKLIKDFKSITRKVMKVTKKAGRKGRF